MADGLQTLMVFFSLTMESIYYLLVISAHIFSNIIMTTSLPDILVKIKHQNQFAADIPSPASMLMYNNSASPISLVYDPSHNITSLTNLLNNFLFLNNYEIPFPWTLSRKFHHSSDLILFKSQLTSSLSRQSLSLLMTPLHLFVLYMFSKHSIPFHVTSDRGLEFVSNFFYSLGTALDMWLYFTLDYHPKSNRQTEHTNQTLE